MKHFKFICFYLLSAFICFTAKGQVINTFAGNHIPGFSGDGGAALSASLGVPWSLAADSAGNIYIVDVSEDVVRKVSASGIITTIAGTDAPGYTGDAEAATSASLYAPSGIALDASGNIYIADDGNYAVRKINSAGIITTIAGTGSSGYSGDGGPALSAILEGAAGITIDTRGNIYVSDGISTVRKIDTAGIITLFAGGAAAGFSGDSGFATLAHLSYPAGLAADVAGNIFIADRNNNVIRKVDTAGIIATVAGNGAFAGLGYGGYTGDSVQATTTELNLPISVFADRTGNLFIADQGNNIIRKVNQAGIIYTIAGVPSFAGYSGDGGPADEAELNAPAAVMTDHAGNLYIADADNNGVRKIIGATVAAISGDTICYGATVTFTVSAAGADSFMLYRWTKNGMVSGTDSTAYTDNALVAGDSISCIIFNSITNDTIAVANTLTIVWRSLPLSVSISASSGDTICGPTIVNFTAAGDSSFNYTWLKNGIASDTGMLYMCMPANGDQIACAVSGAAGCGVSAPFTTTLYSSSTPAVYVNSAGGPVVCPSSVALFTATNNYGGPSPVYKWEVNGDSITSNSTGHFSYMPAEGDIITCVMTSDYVCLTTDTAVSNSYEISLLPVVTPAITISLAGPDTICAGTAVSLSPVIANGGIMPSLQWYKNGIGISTDTIFTYTAESTDTINCLLTSSACASPDSVMSNAIVVNVLPMVTPDITVHTASDSVCAGTLVTYTVADSNAGADPSFLWKVNGTNVSTAYTYSYIPSNGDMVKCVLTSDASCLSTTTAVSEPITMIVDTVFLTPEVSIATTSVYSVCAGTAVSYTATAAIGGSTPFFQWRVNGVNSATGNIYSYSPADGDVISCVLTSSAHCLSVDTALSNLITMTVDSPAIPAVAIASSAGDTVCSGTAITFTASATNGGTAPLYTWHVNNVYEGSGNTFTNIPADGDTIICELSSSAACVATGTGADTVIIYVRPAAATYVSVSAAPGDTVCAGTAVHYTAIAVNGGSAPVFHWKINSVPVAADTIFSYTYAPANGDSVSCILVSNAACAETGSSDTAGIIMTVDSIMSPAINVSATPGLSVCSGTSVTCSAITEQAGPLPVFRWLVNGIATGTAIHDTAYTFTPANGDVVSCVLTSNMACAIPDTAISPAITMTVTPETTPALSITASSGTLIIPGESVTFTAAATNGGSAPVFQWYINGAEVMGATSATFTTDTITANDSVSCIVTSNAPCVTTATASGSLIIQINLGVIQTALQAAYLSLLPNPNRGSFTVRGFLGNVDGIVTFNIENMLGQTIQHTEESLLQGMVNKQISLVNNLPAGVYLLNISAGGTKYIIRFILEN
jgi:sugar lactone lactonase YvrE